MGRLNAKEPAGRTRAGSWRPRGRRCNGTGTDRQVAGARTTLTLEENRLAGRGQLGEVCPHARCDVRDVRNFRAALAERIADAGGARSGVPWAKAEDDASSMAMTVAPSAAVRILVTTVSFAPVVAAAAEIRLHGWWPRTGEGL